MQTKAEVVLVLGSGPNAREASAWPRAPFDHIVCINNAWGVRPDWDATIFPEDFPSDRRPSDLRPGQYTVEADQYVPAQNVFGGVVFAGGTMAFTTGYWVLHALRPRVMAFFGCDMVYPSTGATHYYGTGTADPLREDVTLRDLEAKSARLGVLAAAAGCACVNLSDSESRLLFPRAKIDRLRDWPTPAEPKGHDAVRMLEASLGYDVPSGRYWEEAHRFDPAKLDDIDGRWRSLWEALPVAGRAQVAA